MWDLEIASLYVEHVVNTLWLKIKKWVKIVRFYSKNQSFLLSFFTLTPCRPCVLTICATYSNIVGMKGLVWTPFTSTGLIFQNVFFGSCETYLELSDHIKLFSCNKILQNFRMKLSKNMCVDIFWFYVTRNDILWFFQFSS